MKLIKEAFLRVWQIFFGIFLFDFPGLMQIRILAYQLLIQTRSKAVFSSNIMFYAPHKFSGYRVKAGHHLEISANVRIDTSRSIEIGDYVWISEGAMIFSHAHVGTSEERTKQKKMRLSDKLVIKDKVWIGDGAKILPKVTYIGEGAIIGAGAIVTKNVADFTTVAGNPARIIHTSTEEC